MIAPTAKRRQGYGRAAITAFLHYISAHIEDIRLEFLRRYSIARQDSAESSRDRNLDIRLTVKIGEDNQPSIQLFESLGFVKKEKKANFFGEFELLLPGSISQEWSQSLLKKNGTEYKELAYVPSKVEESKLAAQK